MANNNLSPEIQKKIEQEAEEYAPIHAAPGVSKELLHNYQSYHYAKQQGFVGGATKYALLLHQSEAQNKQLREALEEMKEVMEWMWDNCRLQEGKEYLQSDLFNRPANAIEQANTVLDSRKEVENG